MAGESVAFWRKVGTVLEHARQCRELVHLAWGCRTVAFQWADSKGDRQLGRGWPGKGSASETGKVFSARTDALGSCEHYDEEAEDAFASSRLGLTGPLSTHCAPGTELALRIWGRPTWSGLCPPRTYSLTDRNRHENEQQSGTDAVTAV